MLQSFSFLRNHFISNIFQAFFSSDIFNCECLNFQYCDPNVTVFFAWPFCLFQTFLNFDIFSGKCLSFCYCVLLSFFFFCMTIFQIFFRYFVLPNCRNYSTTLFNAGKATDKMVCLHCSHLTTSMLDIGRPQLEACYW